MPLLNSVTKKLTDYSNPSSLGSKLRKRRSGPLINLIELAATDHNCVKIIDVGGTENYWNIIPNNVLEKHNVQITIVNTAKQLQTHNKRFTHIYADGCDLSGFIDNEFHIAHSNSVIEHTGDWPHMVQFANEIKRIAQRYYVQTPSWFFPIEPHFMVPFFHWLPKPVRVWIVMHMALGHYTKANSVNQAMHIVDDSHLLSKRMFSSLFDDAIVWTERLCLLEKSNIAFRI